MQSITLFYSWQLDHPSELCRDFIRRALDGATEILRGNHEIALKIDSDTQDVPGTPPITETILGKIRECDIFLADMTFVAQAGEKMIPNPNVMGEYGYALGVKGSRRILLAMNEAFGPPEALPFDLHHMRHPEGYNVDAQVSDGARRRARTELGVRLADYIKAIADEIRRGAADADKELQSALKTRWWEAVAARPYNERPALVSTPSVLVHLIPASALREGHLDPRAVKPVRHILRLDDQDGVETGVGVNQWWAHGPLRRVADKPNPEAGWSARLMQPGIVEWDLMVGERVDDDPTIVVNGRRVEGQVVEAADRSLDIARELKLAGPFLLGLVLYGLEEVQLAGPYRTGRRIGVASLVLPTTLLRRDAETAGDHLRIAFDQLWLAGGFEDGSPSFGAGRWAGYDEPASVAAR